MVLYLISLGAASGARFSDGSTETSVSMTYDEWAKQGRPTWVDLNLQGGD